MTQPIPCYPADRIDTRAVNTILIIFVYATVKTGAYCNTVYIGECAACVLGEYGGEGCVDRAGIYDEPGASLAVGHIWMPLWCETCGGLNGDMRWIWV